MSTNREKTLRPSRIPRHPAAANLPPPKYVVEFSKEKNFPLIAVVQTKLRVEAVKENMKSSNNAGGHNSKSDNMMKIVTKKLCDDAGIEPEVLDQTTLMNTDALFFLCEGRMKKPVLVPKLMEKKLNNVGDAEDRLLLAPKKSDIAHLYRWMEGKNKSFAERVHTLESQIETMSKEETSNRSLRNSEQRKLQEELFMKDEQLAEVIARSQELIQEREAAKLEAKPAPSSARSWGLIALGGVILAMLYYGFFA